LEAKYSQSIGTYLFDFVRVLAVWVSQCGKQEKTDFSQPKARTLQTIIKSIFVYLFYKIGKLQVQKFIRPIYQWRIIILQPPFIFLLDLQSGDFFIAMFTVAFHKLDEISEMRELEQ
jgi:hypothetical protein